MRLMEMRQFPVPIFEKLGLLSLILHLQNNLSLVLTYWAVIFLLLYSNYQLISMNFGGEIKSIYQHNQHMRN